MYVRIRASSTFRHVLNEIFRFKDKGHFYQGHLPQRTFFQGRNLEGIFSEDQNSGTFCQGHFLKDICDMILRKTLITPERNKLESSAFRRSKQNNFLYRMV